MTSAATATASVSQDASVPVVTVAPSAPLPVERVEPPAHPAVDDDHGIGEALAKLRTDKSLQFDLPAARPPDPPPDWLRAIGEFIQAAGPLLSWLFWGAVAAVVLLIVYLIARELGLIRLPTRRGAHHLDEPAWRPEASAARALLSDADALAAQGRFGEAAHLLLLRSIEDIARFRPNAVRPALTARDIGAMEALPDRARPIFGGIAQVVERWLWAGQDIAAEDFARCRRDYEAFALPDGWGR